MTLLETGTNVCELSACLFGELLRDQAGALLVANARLSQRARERRPSATGRIAIVAPQLPLVQLGASVDIPFLGVHVHTCIREV